MARKIIVEHRNRGCVSGCLSFCVAIVVAAILIAVLSYVGCVAAGVGLWFLIRYIWRSLVRERPDSGVVRWGLKRAPIARKIMAGALCALVSVILIAAVSSGYASSSNRQDSQNANQTSQEQAESSENSNGDAGNNTSGSASDEAEKAKATLFSSNEKINDLLNAYNEVNASNQFQSDDFTAYKDRKNQAITYDSNGFEVVVTDELSGVSVYVQGYQSGKTAPDDVKAECALWLRAMYPEATDGDIDAVWNEMATDTTHSIDADNPAFDGLEMDANYSFATDGVERIEYIKMWKKA